MGRLEPDASTMPRRSKRRDRLVAMGILVLVVVVPVLVIFVGPVTLKAYDAPHRTEVTCEVRSARTDVGSSRSVKGVGSSSNQVVTETRDCGTLTLRWAVTAGNKLSIADGFAPGTTWNLEVGAGSYQLHPLLNDIRQTVFFTERRRASSPSVSAPTCLSRSYGDRRQTTVRTQLVTVQVQEVLDEVDN